MICKLLQWLIAIIIDEYLINFDNRRLKGSRESKS